MRRASAAAFIGLLSANTVSTLHAQDVDANGINPYSFIAPNGASGRFVQGGVTFSFKITRS